ncbi:hypothetical protein CRG98_012427 [Punica granatum]|uniref:Uncharacterized protein n=1 Tax=Punica granatum TaxID=22663 RepID=A0A2I0KFC5_PUNGR|nr:hypothetical protein CRG98_012427 [Punica granatum]
MVNKQRTVKIDPFNLSETLGHEPSFVTLHSAICPSFNLENPFISNGFLPGRKRLNSPSAIIIKSTNFFCHRETPFGIFGGLRNNQDNALEDETYLENAMEQKWAEEPDRAQLKWADRREQWSLMDSACWAQRRWVTPREAHMWNWAQLKILLLGWGRPDWAQLDWAERN